MLIKGEKMRGRRHFKAFGTSEQMWLHREREKLRATIPQMDSRKREELICYAKSCAQNQREPSQSEQCRQEVNQRTLGNAATLTMENWGWRMSSDSFLHTDVHWN